MTGRLLALVLVSIAAVTSAVVLVSRRTPEPRLIAILPPVQGLSEGAPVSYLGIEIGKIERLHIDRRPVVAELRITRPDAALRRSDIIRYQTRPLFGGTGLEVVQGRAPAPALRDGDTIHFSLPIKAGRLHSDDQAIGRRAVDRLGPDEIAAALAGVSPTAEGVVFPGSRDDHAQYVFNRRSTQSDVEQHDEWDDILIVKDGRGFVRHGGTWQNAKPIYQGERRGGSLIEPQEVEVGPGDVIRIPAGEPHRIVPGEGTPLTYLVVKVRVKRP